MNNPKKYHFFSLSLLKVNLLVILTIVFFFLINFYFSYKYAVLLNQGETINKDLLYYFILNILFLGWAIYYGRKFLPFLKENGLSNPKDETKTYKDKRQEHMQKSIMIYIVLLLASGYVISNFVTSMFDFFALFLSVFYNYFLIHTFIAEQLYLIYLFEKED